MSTRHPSRTFGKTTRALTLASLVGAAGILAACDTAENTNPSVATDNAANPPAAVSPANPNPPMATEDRMERRDSSVAPAAGAAGTATPPPAGETTRPGE